MWLLLPALDMSSLPVQSCSAQKTASGSPSPITKGRYNVRVRDAKGTIYQVRIFAKNEKVEVDRFPGGEFWGKGKNYFTGTYHVTLRRVGARMHRTQRISLFGTDTSPSAEGVFTPWNTRVFVLKGKTGQRADFLLVTQYATSNHNHLRLFFIEKGILVPVIFWRASHKEIGQYVDRGSPMKHLRGKSYQTFFWSPEDGFHLLTWRFDPNVHRMVLLKDERRL